MNGEWNRSNRKSGGNRRAEILITPIVPDDLKEMVALMKQEADIRREFGEEGVKRFWDVIGRRKKKEDHNE